MSDKELSLEAATALRLSAVNLIKSLVSVLTMLDKYAGFLLPASAKLILDEAIKVLTELENVL